MSIFPYHLHYHRSGNFGIDEVLNSTIYFQSVIFNSVINKPDKISCVRNSDTVKVEAICRDIFLSYDKKKSSGLLDLMDSQSGRGYGSIVFRIPRNVINRTLIYFDGVKWQEL